MARTANSWASRVADDGVESRPPGRPARRVGSKSNVCEHHEVFLLPVPRDRPLARAALLVGGLALYGISSALIVRAGLGVVPWDVLHQGLSRTLGLEIGTWSIIVGGLLLVVWIPLRARPGLGTLSNVVVVGLAINATLAVLPDLHGLALQIGALVLGIALNGVATGAYIGAGLGPGPRDGLSTAIAARGPLATRGPHGGGGGRRRRRLPARWSSRCRHRGVRADDRSPDAPDRAGAGPPLTSSTPCLTPNSARRLSKDSPPVCGSRRGSLSSGLR